MKFSGRSQRCDELSVQANVMNGIGEGHDECQHSISSKPSQALIMESHHGTHPLFHSTPISKHHVQLSGNSQTPPPLHPWCLSPILLANSPNVIPFSTSTSSSKFGCVNTANVFLATPSPVLPIYRFLGALTKCGTALNFPFVIISKASPVWKARCEGGMSTLMVSEVRDRM